MTRKLFGTDGVRGTANVYPMTAEMALKSALLLVVISEMMDQMATVL